MITTYFARRSLTFSFCVVALVAAVYSQAKLNAEKVNSTSSPVELTDWQVIDFGDIIISVPPGVAAFDGGCPGCYEFKGLPDGIRMFASLQPPTARPTQAEHKERGYLEAFFKVDGRRVWRWSYEKDPTPYFKYRFFYGLNTDYPRPWDDTAGTEWSIGVQIWSEEDQNSLANAIFKSIRFH